MNMWLLKNLINILLYWIFRIKQLSLRLGLAFQIIEASMRVDASELTILILSWDETVFYEIFAFIF